MTAEETTEQDAEQGEDESSDDDAQGRLGEDIDPEERWKDDETVSDEAKCPECGEPVHNLRMACPMCGHEYEDKEYDDDDAGTEFRAGSEIDESELGEKVKEGGGADKTRSDDAEEEKA